MILPVLLAAMAFSGGILTVLATWTRIRGTPFSRRTALRLLPAVLAAGLLIAYIGTAFPRRHRIYLDEDAYANMSLNVGAGHPGHTTVSYLPNAKRTMLFKWPVAFPVMALPFVRWMGPEAGPMAFNGLCGVLTVFWVMALAASIGKEPDAAIVAAVLFALQPVAIAWYSSGSSEPLSALVSLGALAAAWFARGQTKRNYWPAVSIILAGIALHTRLENVLLLPPVLLLLRRAPRPFPRFVTSAAMVLAAAATVHAVRHYTALRSFYLANVPESTFSLGLFTGNLVSNLQFLWRHAATTGLLSLAALGAVMLRPRGTGTRRSAGLLLLFPLLSSLLLLFYSVGQYEAPGESRFLLLVAAVLSAFVGAEIARLRRFRFGRLGACAAILVLAAVSRSWPATEAYLNGQWTTVACEHDTMLQWAAILPKKALVISHMPYFWENLGFYADMPGQPRSPEAANLPTYLVFGLVSDPREWPSGKMPERRVVTGSGAICLFRLN